MRHFADSESGVSYQPAIDLEVAEAAPPGHDAIDEEDAWSEQSHPADEDACHHAHARIVGDDRACNTGIFV